METYIRDGEGKLCRVMFKTASFYHTERVIDNKKVAVPIAMATIVSPIDYFPGDWAINEGAHLGFTKGT